MFSQTRFRMLICVLALAAGMMMMWRAAAAASLAPPAPTGMATMPTPEGWLLVPTLAADASQADRGGEVYRLVCSACHGGRGQGLTDEWRASWAPSDRNCWQSKCHAVNHPPDGFVLPRSAPAIIGPGALAKFASAADVHAFIKASMPWQQPGSLTDEEYWQLTAFLVRANGHGDLTLAPTNATAIKLATPTVPPSSAPVAASPAAISWSNMRWVLVLAAAAVVGGVLVRGRRRARRQVAEVEAAGSARSS
jgi:cytochrome c5